jgi:hypothetical protein
MGGRSCTIIRYEASASKHRCSLRLATEEIVYLLEKAAAQPGESELKPQVPWLSSLQEIKAAERCGEVHALPGELSAVIERPGIAIVVRNNRSGERFHLIARA